MDYDRLDPALRRFCEFYRDYSPAWLERLGELYAPEVEFHDPFGTLRGDLGALKQHFGKLFKLAESKFLVDDAAVGQHGAYVRWTWIWRWKAGSPQKHVPGVTWLRFGADGKVVYHQDLFDAAEGFFEVVPLLGGALRAVKKRL
jgi:steroid delta-isomerase